jgi:hypothetical protein
MKKSANGLRRIRKILLISAVIEGLTIAYTWTIFSLRLAREPLEPPYNLSAFLIQFPGIYLTYYLTDIFHFDEKVFYVLTYVFQWLTMALIIYAIARLRAAVKSRSWNGGSDQRGQV